jgi:hypothetical protein
MKPNWIQKALARPGSLHKSLDIPKGTKIPMTLINAIIKAHAGDIINNPTKTGKKIIKVSRRLERRAILAKNLKTMSHNK